MTFYEAFRRFTYFPDDNGMNSLSSLHGVAGFSPPKAALLFFICSLSLIPFITENSSFFTKICPFYLQGCLFFPTPILVDKI